MLYLKEDMQENIEIYQQLRIKSPPMKEPKNKQRGEKIDKKRK